MRIHEAADENSIRGLLDHFDACHDGVIRRISFIKNRTYSDEGNVCWPAELGRRGFDTIKCDIEMEVLLNSYVGASPKQVVIIRFEDVQSFRFFQDHNFDYSAIFEVILHQVTEQAFEFAFRLGMMTTTEPIDALTVVSRKIVCTEV